MGFMTLSLITLKYLKEVKSESPGHQTLTHIADISHVTD